MRLELVTNKDTEYIGDIIKSKIALQNSLRGLSVDEKDGRLELEYGEDVEGMSSLITDVLMEYKFPEYLSLYARKDYPAVDEYFRSKAFLLTLKYFWCDDGEYRNSVKAEVGKYINNNNELNIDGFLCFKLKDSVKQWQSEYAGNIRMLMGAYEGTRAMMELASYVSSQPKNKFTLHIAVKDKKYSFGQNIRSEDFVYTAKEVFSMAVEKLPEKICYHRKKDEDGDELSWILLSVFGGSVTVIDF